MYIQDMFVLMRPHQYLKNVFIFLPLFFSLQITNMPLLAHTVTAFIAFSMTASGVYVVNDYFDMQNDRMHPVKQYRPLASGRISRKQAFVFAALLFFAGFAMMGMLSFAAVGILLAYVLLNIAYTLLLKHLAVIDVTVIAIGFVLRIFVGTTVTGLDASMWIVVMTFLLALFLALAKRRDDILIFNRTGQKMRKVIDGYNIQFVDMAMTLMAGVVIVAYLMYCVSPEVIARTGSDKLYLTLIYVIVGIMRYMQITFVEEVSGSPTKILLQDRMIQIVIVMWIVTFGMILY